MDPQERADRSRESRAPGRVEGRGADARSEGRRIGSVDRMLERTNREHEVGTEVIWRGDSADGVEFIDRSNVHWRVTERDAAGDPGAHDSWCLIFSCAQAVRRVWNYPHDWRELSAAALIALSWER
jgi:hypothetical protein